MAKYFSILTLILILGVSPGALARGDSYGSKSMSEWSSYSGALSTSERRAFQRDWNNMTPSQRMNIEHSWGEDRLMKSLTPAQRRQYMQMQYGEMSSSSMRRSGQMPTDVDRTDDRVNSSGRFKSDADGRASPDTSPNSTGSQNY
ncbi:MAG: hypothetical protein AB7G80_05850 [Dongiaceae bacterium]